MGTSLKNPKAIKIKSLKQIENNKISMGKSEDKCIHKHLREKLMEQKITKLINGLKIFCMECLFFCKIFFPFQFSLFKLKNYKK